MRFLLVYRDGIPYRLVSDKNWKSPADIINLPFIQETDEVVGHWVEPERKGGQQKEENGKESRQTKHFEKNTLKEKRRRGYGIPDALRKMLEEWGEKLDWVEEQQWEEESEVTSTDYEDETELELVVRDEYDDEEETADSDVKLSVVGRMNTLEDAYVIEFKSMEKTEEVVGNGKASETREVEQEREENENDVKETRTIGKYVIKEKEGAEYGNVDKEEGLEESQEMGIDNVEEKKDVRKYVDAAEVTFEDVVVEQEHEYVEVSEEEVDEMTRVEENVREETLKGTWQFPDDETRYRTKGDHYYVEFKLESIFRLHYYTDGSPEDPIHEPILPKSKHGNRKEKKRVQT